MQQCQMQIVENMRIARDTYRMSLRANELDLSLFTPGCFINIKIDDSAYLLRRPISLYEIDLAAKLVRIIYKVLGKGTELMSKMAAGEELNILGPLGSGFPIQNDSQSVLLAGGGVGVPPLYELGKRLQERGVTITSVLGFQDADSVYAIKEFETLGQVFVSTIDGSFGQKGTIIDILNKQEIEFDTLYSCGPAGMLKALDEKYQGKKEGYLSFEERMACGIGACYGCMVNTKAGLKRVCKDGPVFALGEVSYE
ncbi:dihydroorotate dehydrogenase electron transfer subunit [Clostridiales bacterium COT073_COT-073]|nr:dihydroorotate dehydrogenase electron transfer subunit [Clostridiales bacterium COT073_COT-073]